ncbi:MAG: sulfatase, partial [Draconibacterium sp.]|nr:sulfatase [Draconibacterium sp.]
MRPNFRILFLLFITALFYSSCEKVPEETRPNIVWINCEDTGPDWGCYGLDYATTPNIDKLAEDGIVFNKAYATAPICAPARSCLITGLYATSLGTQHLRCEVDRPDFIKTLPEILSQQGYFTTNQAKTDYNFDPEGVWNYWQNELSPWRKRKGKQPFFSMFVFGMTHEGSANRSEKWEENTRDLPKELFHDPTKVPVPPHYPDTPEIRKIWSHYHDNITVFDRKVGEIVQNLKDDNLLDNTIIFVFSDHGAGLPRHKRWLNVTGLHVPLVVYVPEKFKHMSRVSLGEKNDELVSFVDFAPTVLSMAGAEIPKTMEGQPFMGRRIAPER